MFALSNAPAPDELLLTARQALKSVLCDQNADHTYTILMVMNALGIASRAMQADESAPAHSGMSDSDFSNWVRRADLVEILDPALIQDMRQHVEQKLAVSNPRFRAPVEAGGFSAGPGQAGRSG